MSKIPDPQPLSRHARHLGGSLPPLKDLVAQVDLPALVERYAGPGKRLGNRWLFCCPHPQHPDHSPSFSVKFYGDGIWRAACLSQCGKVGDALAFVKWVEGCDTKTAADKLRSLVGQPSAFTWQPPRKTKTYRSVARVAAVQPDPGYTTSDNREALAEYLASRGWPSEAADRFGLRVVGLNRPSERGIVRVLHPFHDYNERGELYEAAWQARRLDSCEDARWLSPRNTAMPIYNLGALEADNLTAAIICEGPADTVTAWLATRELPGVACVGVAGVNGWRDEWAAMFQGLAVVIAADNDEAGETFTWVLARKLAGVAASLVAACPPHGTNDLTDLLRSGGVAEVRELLTSALPTVAPSFDLVAEVPRLFPGSFTVCAVCAKPTTDSYCDNCSRLARLKSGRRKRYEWAACDKCGKHSLNGNGKLCYGFRCGGTFVTCEVQP